MKKPIISFSPVGFALLVENVAENSGARIQTEVACKRKVANGNWDYANTETGVYGASERKNHKHAYAREENNGRDILRIKLKRPQFSRKEFLFTPWTVRLSARAFSERLNRLPTISYRSHSGQEARRARIALHQPLVPPNTLKEIA